ncbi:MAG: aminoacyl-tRNA hydrolase [Halobacteriovoraceae bacterium]|jgi:peptidyl-tRNA hydrolase, PTH1 family|nr:aminoacyl-tRNA hydrolase [Halobacteriovoraceae bacterium]MBT5095396.1 aminoacyl-tRNA hydrolase [Halobacteriovoraceae bacterium]
MTVLIVGLGNPGREYEDTRHNIGWQVLEYLSFHGGLVWKEKFKGLYAQTEFAGQKVYLLKPHTYMNLSGESVLPLMQFFKVEKSELLVAQDEIDLPFGSIQLKNGGGLAGHNGLKSIASKLGGQDFYRIRLGVGRPVHGDVSSWVLSKYNNDDAILLEKFLKEGAKAIEAFIEKGFDSAQRSYSNKKVE